MHATVCWGSIRNRDCILYPGAGTVVLIRPAQTFYERIKVVFIFQHHSGRFGLYYDILCPGLVGRESGGGPRVTSTILTKGRTFVPIPEELVEDFLPRANERKRLEVRADILYLEEHVKPAWDFSP